MQRRHQLIVVELTQCARDHARRRRSNERQRISRTFDRIETVRCRTERSRCKIYLPVSGKRHDRFKLHGIAALEIAPLHITSSEYFVISGARPYFEMRGCMTDVTV